MAVAQNYGAFGRGVATGDTNFDGAVDFADLVNVAQRYGKTLPPPVLPAPVSASPVAAPALAGAQLQKSSTKTAKKKSEPVFATKPIKAPVLERKPVGHRKR